MAIPTHSHWYLLMGISIALWYAVDVRLSSPFLSSPQPPFYSTYSAISMDHAHILREDWKSLRTSKVWNNCLACHRGCAWVNTLCDEDRATTRLYDFVGITFFGHVILRRHDCLVSMLEVLLFFMSILNFCLESFGSEYSYHN